MGGLCVESTYRGCLSVLGVCGRCVWGMCVYAQAWRKQSGARGSRGRTHVSRPRSADPSLCLQRDTKGKGSQPLPIFIQRGLPRGPTDAVIPCRALLQGVDVRRELGNCALQPSGPRLPETSPLQLPRGQRPHLHQVGHSTRSTGLGASTPGV